MELYYLCIDFVFQFIVEKYRNKLNQIKSNHLGRVFISSLLRCIEARLCISWGGGGWSLPLEVVPDARESPSKKHPKRGFNGIPRDTLNKSPGPISTSYNK